jgi:ABC-type nickel/cobalt efflux system permease component RcnA
LFGNTIALFHGLSAVVLVVLLKTALVAFTGQALDQVEHLTKIVSYGLVTLIGLFLLIGAVRNYHPPGKAARPFRAANLWVMAATIGLVPCPGVVLVLLFSLSQGILRVGLLMALFQTLGMAVTISLVTIAVTTGRRGGLMLAGENEKTLARVESGLQLAAGLAVFGLGALFLANALWLTVR